MPSNSNEIGTIGFSRTKQMDEEARLARIHDAKTRTIGVDESFLSTQVGERQQREADETATDLAHSKLAEYFDRQICIKEQEMRELKAQINRNVDDYRKEFQNKEQRREWDLNDPDQLKNSIAARTGDLDERNGPSSLQRLAGEDLLAEERRKAQMVEQCAWAGQQVSEKQAKKDLEKKQDAFMVDMMNRQLKIQVDVEKENNRLRKALDDEIADKNKELAAIKDEKERLLKEHELSLNDTEQNAVQGNPMMTEDPRLGVSFFQPHRTRVDHWKGMSDAEKEGVLEAQARQRDELKKKREYEHAQDQQYAWNEAQIRKALYIQSGQVDDFRKEQYKLVADANLALKAEKQERDNFLNQTVYQNEPDNGFFSQFGTKSR